ncbi:MAG: hypothetical protein HRT71_09650 [Flavobacteriales bacterium]|nr:hypothetical protein [Flavobacteriales bacterium]
MESQNVTSCHLKTSGLDQSALLDNNISHAQCSLLQKSFKSTMVIFNKTHLNSKLAAVFVVLMLSATSLIAQGNEGCLEKVIAANAQIKDKLASLKSTALLLDFTVRTVTNTQNKKIESSVRSKVYHSTNSSHMISDDVAVYQDQEVSIVIGKTEKTLLITQRGNKANKDKMVANSMAVADSLFSYCKVTSCKEVTIKNKPALEITLVPNATGKRVVNAKQMIYTIDKASNLLRNVKIIFDQTYGVVEMEITYHNIDYNYPINKIKPAISYVFAVNGQLLEKYNSYRIKDLRQLTSK